MDRRRLGRGYLPLVFEPRPKITKGLLGRVRVLGAQSAPRLDLRVLEIGNVRRNGPLAGQLCQQVVLDVDAGLLREFIEELPETVSSPKSMSFSVSSAGSTLCPYTSYPAKNSIVFAGTRPANSDSNASVGSNRYSGSNPPRAAPSHRTRTPHPAKTPRTRRGHTSRAPRRQTPADQTATLPRHHLAPRSRGCSPPYPTPERGPRSPTPGSLPTGAPGTPATLVRLRALRTSLHHVDHGLQVVRSRPDGEHAVEQRDRATSATASCSATPVASPGSSVAVETSASPSSSSTSSSSTVIRIGSA